VRSAEAVAAEVSVESAAISKGRSAKFVAAAPSLASSADALHADPLGDVPTSYLPTGGLVDSLDARVGDPSARCAVRRGYDFPLASLVGEAIADLKLHREDLGGGLCRFALLLGAWFSHVD